MGVQDREDLAELAPDGTVRPVGARAIARLQARPGTYRLRPSPAPLLVLERAEAGEAPRPCLLSGEIRSAGALCDVLTFVGHVGWTGEFVVQESESARSIMFDQGNVVGAQSNVPDERLGEVLYRYGALTREQVTAASEACAAGALRFGEAVVKLGLASREKLFGLMHHQTEEIFFAMMRVEGALFYFFEGYDESQLSSRQKLSVTSLVREGIRRTHEMRFFRARVRSDRHVPYRMAGAAAPEIDTDGVYAAIDGVRSVADICRVVGAGEFEVTRTLFQLLQAGHVGIRPPPLPASEAVVVYNRAVSLILRELDAMDEGDSVRDQIVAFATTTGSVHAELLASAVPADDGTFDAAEIARKVARATSPRDAELRLAEWLYELASYALFLARPHLRRMEEARSGKPRLSVRVTALLEPIAPRPDRRAGAEPTARASAKKRQ